MICGTSGTFFWYPVVSREFGFIGGAIALILILLLTYTLTCFIEEAYRKTNEDNYLILIEKFLNKGNYYWACFTFISDYLATYIIGILLGYYVLLYIMYYLGMVDKESVVDFNLLQFNESYP